MSKMTDSENPWLRELEAKLRSVEETFAREMRERGFELDQTENVALPGSLARLYAEREALKAQLEEEERGGLDERD